MRLINGIRQHNQPYTMPGYENEIKAMLYLAKQATATIDYEWEIQHHRQMHEAYERNL